MSITDRVNRELARDDVRRQALGDTPATRAAREARTYTTYESPLGVTFRASTPEHAAARAYGGKPADYLATVHEREGYRGQPTYRWVEVTRADTGEWVGDIPEAY